MSIDVRGLANLILDVGEEIGIQTTNLGLNKVAYFLHGWFLARKKEPLVRAKIEAWEYGPVFREIYFQFKNFGANPITSRATKVNLETGEKEVCGYELLAEDFEFLRGLAEQYLRIRPGRLVDLSHAQDGPWHKAWFYDGSINPGMEIEQAAIEEFFAQQVRH
ncbi:MAG: DUF4065 domain-containing protein [Sphingomonadaceae bacterium]|nr:DUF4065 domain-containing protein [Sphingomonadaceae bacterium]